jgi:hypothetical protein
MKIVHAISVLAVFAALGAGHAPSARAASADRVAHVQAQPHMQAALAALRSARDFLAKAEHDKGGWRTAALGSTDKAIAETVRGMAFDATHNEASVDPIPLDAQPNMEAALAKLREAKTQLQAAEHDKGGWRVAAIASTEAAITETQRGIAFANAH